MNPTIRIGTRGSKLALAQSGWVQRKLQQLHPGANVELVIIKTTGDRFVDQPLSTLGGKGVFVKEIEEALQARSIDCAVHSMKDVPGTLADGLVIGAVPEREDARDVLLTRGSQPLGEIATGARVGTSSLRRMALLRELRPDLLVDALRGNVDSRLRKLDEGEFDAIILAAAGLKRLEIERADANFLDTDLFLPAVGQGALAIEARCDESLSLLAGLEHGATRTAITAERAFLSQVGGSCRTPLAAYAQLHGTTLTLRALIANPDGTKVIRGSRTAPIEDAEDLGAALGADILQRGGAEILRTLAENPNGG